MYIVPLFICLSSDEVQASPRSSVGGEEDRKSERSERSEHSKPREPEPAKLEPEPEVEQVVAAVREVEIEKGEELASEHLPRNCHISKCPDFQRYGFNLHAERDSVGQFIGKIDDDSPAEAAGLREGDRIIEVNGTNIENETHQQVIRRIKAGGDSTKLLVVDREVDDYYKAKGTTISSDMSVVRQLSNPLRGKGITIHCNKSTPVYIVSESEIIASCNFTQKIYFFH